MLIVTSNLNVILYTEQDAELQQQQQSWWTSSYIYSMLKCQPLLLHPHWVPAGQEGGGGPFCRRPVPASSLNQPPPCKIQPEPVYQQP